MNRIVLGLLLVVFVLASGCAGRRPLSPMVFDINEPPLDKEMVVEIGESLVRKGKLFRYHSMTLRNPAVAGDGVFFAKWTVAPGTLLLKEETANHSYYHAEEFIVRDLLGTHRSYGGIRVAKKKVSTADGEIWSDERGWETTMRPKDALDYELGFTEARERAGFHQELIYSGRAGNQVKFVYREFRNDLIRPGFTQEVQYDLGEGPVIGFKGARVEIVEATNTRLKYKLVSSFPE